MIPTANEVFPTRDDVISADEEVFPAREREVPAAERVSQITESASQTGERSIQPQIAQMGTDDRRQTWTANLLHQWGEVFLQRLRLIASAINVGAADRSRRSRQKDET